MLFLALNRKKIKEKPSPHRILILGSYQSCAVAVTLLRTKTKDRVLSSGTRLPPFLRTVSFLRIPESAAHSKSGCVCAVHKMKASLGTDTVRTRIIGPEAKTLELPLLVKSGSFYFLFCLKFGLRVSVFAVRSPPYPREGISDVLTSVQLFEFLRYTSTSSVSALILVLESWGNYTDRSRLGE